MDRAESNLAMRKVHKLSSGSPGTKRQIRVLYAQHKTYQSSYLNVCLIFISVPFRGRLLTGYNVISVAHYSSSSVASCGANLLGVRQREGAAAAAAGQA